MRVLPHRLTLVLALLGGCKGQTARSPAIAAAAPAPASRAASVDWCRGRARCSLSGEAVAEVPGVDLVTVRIAHMPDASTDEAHCDRREYWLARASGNVLIAVDCETQWGADNAGPAKVKVEGKRLKITYIEMQSGDACELYMVTLDVAKPSLVESEHRHIGKVVHNLCRPAKRVAADPLGDGSAAHPLLTLHR